MGNVTFSSICLSECVWCLSIAELPGLLARRSFLTFDELGVDPSHLDMVITTHPDSDHQGGDNALREMAPSILIACGEPDRRMVQYPRVLYEEQYNFLKSEHEIGFDDNPLDDAGFQCRVGIGFAGGEHIALDLIMTGNSKCFTYQVILRGILRSWIGGVRQPL